MIKYDLNSIESVNRYDYTQLSGNIYKIHLRTDIVNHTTYYSYNEYVLVTEISSEDIDDTINNNFDSYLEIAKLNDEERKKENMIETYKHTLNNSDYMIIKNLENYVLGLTLPYEYSTLIAKRQELRDNINNLESTESSTLDAELAQCKSRKITEMCAVCQTTITNGIDYNNEHYRLNATDQINLTSLYTLAQAGQSVPYHADGSVCRIYKPDELIGLVQSGIKWVTYHTTYFNLLKHQIESMETVEEISNVTYGMTLKDEYQAIINAITSGDSK